MKSSLSGRLVTAIGLATILPLVALTIAIVVGAYQIVRDVTFAGLEQASQRIASEFETRINAKLGLLRGAVLSLEQSPGSLSTDVLLRADPDFLNVWIREFGPAPDESSFRQLLFREVQAGDSEVLSAPDFDTYQVAIGVPIHRKGTFAGMLAVSFSLEVFQRAISEVRLLDSGYGFLVSHQGYRIAHPNRALVGQRIGGDVDTTTAQGMLDKISKGQNFWLDKNSLVTGQPSRQFYSAIHFGRAKSPWYFVVVASTGDVVQQVNSLLLYMTLGVLLTLGLVVLSTRWAARSVIRPLKRIVESAEAISAGQLDTRVVCPQTDELGLLADVFNQMTEQLVCAFRDQERLVRDRTDQLLSAEKMAVLGRLTATFAHEINTPLGAIRSSAVSMHQALTTGSPAFLHRLRELTSTEMVFFEQLVTSSGTWDDLAPGQSDRLRRKTLTSELALREVPSPEDLAECIMLVCPPGQEGPLLDGVSRGMTRALKVAAEWAMLDKLARIALRSEERVAATVSALVDYTRGGVVDANQWIDLERDLDNILALYEWTIRRGVVIEKRFQPGATVRGDRTRLNQVWVNLINNALQAMEYRGTLRLTIEVDGEATRVAVANSGPPIPDELRTKIFEPFFTTKKDGEGSGLGLDICRRIVEAHQGSIQVFDRDGMTVFEVQFPVPHS